MMNLSLTEPLCLLRRVLKHAWLIVLAACMGFMLADVVSGLGVIRSYSCTATFVVNARSTGAYYGTSDNSAAQSYVSILESDMMKLVVTDALEGTTPGQISAAQLGSTNLIQVTVTASEPKTALLTIQALMDNHHRLSDYYSSQAVLNVFSAPNVSMLTSQNLNPQTLRRYAVVGCGGAMAALVIWLCLNTPTVQNSAGAKALLDTPVLVSIPHQRRNRKAGKTLRITDNTVNFAFSEAIHRMASQLEARKKKGESQFLFTSAQAGEGKSTITGNTALSLAMKGNRVLLIDLDLRKPIQSQILGISCPGDRDLGKLLLSGTSAREILASTVTEPQSGLDALLSCQAYPQAVDRLSSQTLAGILGWAKERYDYVLVDLPPVGLFSESEVLSDLCDGAVLVVRQDRTPAAEINDAVDALNAGRSRLLGCVLNDMRHLAAGSTGYGYGYGKYGYGRYGYGKYGYGRNSKEG